VNRIRLSHLLRDYRPGWYRQPWSWDDLERNTRTRQCLCCGRPGHYLRVMEERVAAQGFVEPILLGDDGTVRDGHHRILAARTAGIEWVPLETEEQAQKRWVRDHGLVDWEHRRFGDR
jgi:hypothetical protein